MISYGEWAISPYTPILHVPVLKGIGILDLEENWSAKPHIHPVTSEIMYIGRGKGSATVDDRSYSIAAGDLMVYNPGQNHWENFSDSSIPPLIYSCEFSSLQILGLPAACIIPPGAPAKMSASYLGKDIAACFQVLFEESYQQRLGYEQILYSRLETLILYTLRIYADYMPEDFTGEDEKNLAVSAKSYIDENFCEDISLRKISEAVHVTPGYLSHIFGNHYHLSPIQYLIARRMSEARRMLLTSRISVKEVAYRLGYRSLSNFILQFRQQFGQAPTRFRLTKRFSEDNPNTWTQYLR